MDRVQRPWRNQNLGGKIQRRKCVRECVDRRNRNSIPHMYETEELAIPIHFHATNTAQLQTLTLALNALDGNLADGKKIRA